MFCPFLTFAVGISKSYILEQRCRDTCALYDKNNKCCAVFTYLSTKITGDKNGKENQS